MVGVSFEHCLWRPWFPLTPVGKSLSCKKLNSYATTRRMKFEYMYLSVPGQRKFRRNTARRAEKISSAKRAEVRFWGSSALGPTNVITWTADAITFTFLSAKMIKTGDTLLELSSLRGVILILRFPGGWMYLGLSRSQACFLPTKLGKSASRYFNSTRWTYPLQYSISDFEMTYKACPWSPNIQFFDSTY